MQEVLSVPHVKSCLKFLLLFWIIGSTGIPAIFAQREKLPPEDLEFVEKHWPDAKKTNTGIRYIIQREGTGDIPKPGNRVAVLYVGRLLNGTVFDEQMDKADPFVFRVRREEVIQGWDEILQLMKVGEKRLVIIPPELAYGTRGQPPKIGRNATLVFEIELLEIRKD
jgi:FKBP-type peptidyl-prolyl cis-trans isomerase